ncbi:MAG: exodeoxyribonuclease V subunit gamma [Clostridia bacterium]|nr:exodeoxyribonuclease V subunit gamma [Clostridia bacterium]
MIRFYYHAGSPQTRAKLTEAIRRDLADGREVLLLVPEQETVSVELRMLRELPASAQLTFEVSNFSRFANRVFRRLGGLSLRAASPAVSALLMWQILREMASTLHQYGSAAAKDSALCDLMLATDAQCRTACIDPENLTSAIDKLSEKGDPLGGKLSDLKAILTAYRARLEKKHYDDSSTDLNRLKDKLETDEGKALLQNTCVYIDSFADFTTQELGVIGAITAAAPSVAITFPLANRNTESGLHLSSVVNSHRHLQQRVKGDVERLCEEAALPEAPLDYFSHHLFNMSARPYFQKRTADSPQSSDTWECPSDKAKREKGKGGLCPLGASVEKNTCPLREDEACPTLGYGKDFPISLTVCDSPFEEATAIATQIHRLVRTVPDCRYRDITVVVRDATAWNGILDDAFQREGIPYFISEKTDVTLRPLIKLINGALRIRLRGWRPEDVVSYLKTGLCGVSDEDVNLFEEYLNVWHPKGERAYTGQPFSKNPDGYKTELSPRGARILEAANRVREALIAPLQQFFKALKEAENATALCRAIYDFLNILDIRKKLAEQAKECFANKEYREAEELSRLYGITVEALEAVSDAIGDQKLSVNELSDALKLVFSRTDIGSIPTSIDQVTVGSASMLRTDHPRFVLIAGLNDGSFPAAVRDDGLLSEADRRQLLDFKIVFPSNSEKMVSDELLYLHRAVAAPREGLFLSYSKRGADGRKLSPSIAINRVHALLPGLAEQPFAGLAPLDRIYSKNGAIEAYTELPEAQKALLPEGLISLPFQNVNTVERHAAISPEVADQLFGNSKFNPSQLESFATCAFRYYCDSILCLRREPNGEMTAADTGTFIHHVLEHVMKAVSKDKTLFSTTDALYTQV